MLGLTEEQKKARQKVKPFYTRGASLTKQEFKDDCDIRKIMERARKYGVPVTDPNQKVFADISNIGDFQSVIQNGMELRQEFANLVRSDVRRLFDNNPEKIWEFMQDPANEEKCIEYGLKKKILPPKPQKVEVVNSISPDAPDGASKGGEK